MEGNHSYPNAMNLISLPKPDKACLSIHVCGDHPANFASGITGSSRKSKALGSASASPIPSTYMVTTSGFSARGSVTSLKQEALPSNTTTPSAGTLPCCLRVGGWSLPSKPTILGHGCFTVSILALSRVQLLCGLGHMLTLCPSVLGHIAWHAAQGMAAQFLEADSHISENRAPATDVGKTCKSWGKYDPKNAAYLKDADDSGI